MTTEIGLMVEGQAGLNWQRWDRVLKMAEDVGFQCVFRSDHFTNASPPDLDSLELFVSLTYAAMQTERIEFGSLVAPVTFRHPTMTLRQAAQIDDLSGGRLTLGLGAGWQAREHTNYGVPFYDFTTRFEQLTDALEIGRLLHASAEPVSYEGKHISVEEAVLLPRPARPTPILIGGNGPNRTLPLAARWNGVFIDAPTYQARSQRLDELLAGEGRPASAVKRSMMMPFAWVSGADGVQTIGRYADAGCQRFMLQIVEYDDLSEIEQWGRANLPRFHGG
jgi:alkanesulfonate monooxygenase SsuD/methylene tetrahydromethanopterin reductase-like flavin-dependent oxidoreductase (luciferase family)